MNLREEIINHIDSHNYDDLAKVRWIYLYICSVFSYDARYIFGNSELKNEIYYKSVDIQNVADFEIVCYTMAKVIVDALSIYNIKGYIEKEKSKDMTHVFVLVEVDGQYLKLDPMIQHDTSRTKLGLNSISFTTIDEDDYFEERLNEIDKFIDFHTTSIDFLKIKEVFDQENNGLSQEKIFLKKLELIFDLVNKQNVLNKYDDVDYYLSYLFNKMEINEPSVFVKTAVFYKFQDNNKWDFLDLILVEYPGLPIQFYKMDNSSGKYQITECDKDELEYFFQNYDSMYKYYFESKLSKIK